ncbi:hypothetical protein [Pedobacter antarcticus]|uniref:hypothetical protein n=1 Tax=Pedobacter antarcticus TaxID=34086 RepID=UPI0012F995F6|nr:hypothetical protein [Pedobacter antarcticus]
MTNQKKHRTDLFRYEVSLSREMETTFMMYAKRVAVHYHFGYFSRTTCKDFIS